MEFKVGDRVKVVEPAEGLIDGQANNLGAGTVLDFDDYQVRVKVDANDGAWWYDLQNVRPLIPAGAITIKKEDPPTTVVDLTTPSITVGTQVRLTGVVSEVDSAATAKHIGVKFGNSEDEPLLWFSAGEVEVIRQPFKRGEVVWQGTTELSVLADEEANTVLLVEPMAGAVAFGADANLFERRP